MVKNTKYQLHSDSHCIYAVVTGSWCDYDAKAFRKDFLKQVQLFSGRPFCHLVYFDEFVFSVPEIEKEIQLLVDHLVLLGMRYVAQVIPSEFYNITQFQLEKMTQTKGNFEKRAFSTLIDAQSWLNNQVHRLDSHANIKIEQVLFTKYLAS